MGNFKKVLGLFPRGKGQVKGVGVPSWSEVELSTK
jgi:hypothetical protein